ncbi:unnamed protein product [Staurois parvus]|uniref:Uncharacterized protein n=1 Tax=Staurois parvus TaxID=386267 RepID=A0ABN9GGX8_9NEOB|nr:unnamed protein product [Staurois parvus]
MTSRRDDKKPNQIIAAAIHNITGKRRGNVRAPGMTRGKKKKEEEKIKKKESERKYGGKEN